MSTHMEITRDDRDSWPHPEVRWQGCLEIDPWAEAPSWITDVRPHGTFYRELSESEAGLQPDDAGVTRLARSAVRVSAVKALAGVLIEKGLRGATLAVDETRMPPSLWRTLGEALPEAQIVDGSGILRATRMVKTPGEVERLARAARVNEEAFGLAVKAMAAGVTHRELVRLYTSEVARRGGMAYASSISAGPWSAHVHPNVSDYVLRPGDLVKSDVACTDWISTGRTQLGREL